MCKSGLFSIENFVKYNQVSRRYLPVQNNRGRQAELIIWQATRDLCLHPNLTDI